MLPQIIQGFHPFVAIGPHRFHDSLQNYVVAVPFVVRRHDEPGSLRLAASLEGVFVGRRVIVPILPLLPVVDVQLPGPSVL